MSKAILMSIRPEHLINILSGNKTLELRKSVPKDYKGWVYIYCTKSKPYIRELGDNYFTECSKVDVYKLNGKVVVRFWFDETYYIKQAVNVYGDELNQISIYDNKSYGWKAPKEQQEILKQLCLTEQEVLDYGKGKILYTWNIKNLEIFDEPMELSDFYKATLYATVQVIKEYEKRTNDFKSYRLQRPPQSWQYVWVEEV